MGIPTPFFDHTVTKNHDLRPPCVLELNGAFFTPNKNSNARNCTKQLNHTDFILIFITMT